MGKRIFITVLTALLLTSFWGCEDNVTVVMPDDTETGMPSVVLIQPVDGGTIAEAVQLIAEATDDKGIVNVTFYVDARPFASDVVPPYTANWIGGSEENGTGHVFYAVATDGDENSASSPTVFCTTDTSLYAPSVPVLFAPTDVTVDQFTVTWSSSPDVDFSHYTVLWDSSSGVPTMFSMNIADATDTVIVIDGLVDTTLYKIVVQNHDIYGNLATSDIVEATTLNAPPPGSVINSIERFAGFIRIEWNAIPVPDFAEYFLIRSDDSLLDSGDDTLIYISDQFVTTFDDNTAVDTTDYYYFIGVSDLSGLSTVSGAYKTGIIGNFSLSFNGLQYVTVPFYSDLNLGDQYSLEAWVKPNQVTAFSRVIDKGSGGESPYLQYSLTCEPTIGTDLCNGTDYSRLHSNTIVVGGTWSHIAMTYNQGIVRYYLNGQYTEFRTATGIGSCGFNTTLNIGRRKLFDEFYFDGLIDEVRIWNVVRSESEVADTYDIRLNGSETGLAGYWSFDEGDGDAVNSPVGGSGHLGSQPGADSQDPTWSTDSPPLRF